MSLPASGPPRPICACDSSTQPLNSDYSFLLHWAKLGASALRPLCIVVPAVTPLFSCPDAYLMQTRVDEFRNRARVKAAPPCDTPLLILIAVLLGLSFAVPPALAQQNTVQANGQPEVLTVDDAIKVALANNRTLKIVSLNLGVQNEKLAADKTKRLPSFNSYIFGSQLLTPFPTPSLPASLARMRRPALFRPPTVTSPRRHIQRRWLHSPPRSRCCRCIGSIFIFAGSSFPSKKPRSSYASSV